MARSLFPANAYLYDANGEEHVEPTIEQLRAAFAGGVFENLGPEDLGGFNPRRGDRYLYEDSEEDDDHDSRRFLREMGLGLPGQPPLPREIRPAQVRAQARPLAESIFESWARLREIVLRHEATLQSRWIKKSKVKRRALLLQAWPDMPQPHRPDIAAWKRRPESQAQAHVVAPDQSPYMFPDMNLEDLTKTEPLLLMLNSRGRHAPDKFATTDLDRMQFGKATSCLDLPFLNLAGMVFVGRKTPETYGQLYVQDDPTNPPGGLKDHILAVVAERRAVLPGEGLLTLKAQARIYQFLVRCCELVLHDLTGEELVSGDCKPEPPPVSANQAASGVSSLAVTALEAQYRLPASLDIKRLIDIVGARVEEAEEHLFAMREDPGYFASVLAEMREHRPEYILDEFGQAHDVTAKRHEGELWARVVRKTTRETFLTLGYFALLRDELTNLARLQAQYEGTFTAEDDLPEPYEMGFQQVQHLLDKMMKIPIRSINSTLPCSPFLRHVFSRKSDEHPGKPPLNFSIDARPARTKAEKSFQFCWRTMSNEVNLLQMGPKGLIDEMEGTVRTEPDAKKFITPLIAKQISDLSIVIECLHQTKLYQPWAARFQYHLTADGCLAAVQRDFADKTKFLERTHEIHMDRSLTDLAMPTGSRFLYPAHKRASKATVQAMRDAEANLDAFWAKCLRLLRTKGALTPQIEAVFQRELYRTPPWTEPLPAPSVLPAATAGDEIVTPFSGLGFGEDPGPQGDVRKTSKAKSKVKTRGLAQPAAEQQDQQQQREDFDVGDAIRLQPPRQTFAVDRRALKVFDSLFYTPASSQPAGETNWADFLHAMVSTGFRAEKLGGSAWQFSPPPKLDVERGIQFHEPHPSSKVPFLMCRRMGRRLWRAYGFERETFTEEGS